MIRLSDAVFISSEPDCDSVIAIRIKNGNTIFSGGWKMLRIIIM